MNKIIEWAIFLMIGFIIGCFFAEPNATLSACAQYFEQMGC